jgi:hypothetical protein
MSDVWGRVSTVVILRPISCQIWRQLGANVTNHSKFQSEQLPPVNKLEAIVLDQSELVGRASTMVDVPAFQLGEL